MAMTSKKDYFKIIVRKKGLKHNDDPSRQSGDKTINI